jgi:acetyl esterase/lipase
LQSRQGNANRGDTNQRNTRNNNNQSNVTTKQLLAQVPQGVTVVPDIAYRQGNEAWQLDMALPSTAASQPRPAIVFIHGGGWRNGDKRATSFMNPMLDYAAKGYVCVSLNYRLIRDDSTTVKECVEDVKCAVRWLRAHAKEYNVDPNRIGATGNSAGAHLSAMLGLCPPTAGMEVMVPGRTIQAVFKRCALVQRRRVL